MYEQSGLLSKAAFIKARVFGDVFRVIKTNRGTLEYVAKLTQLHAQYRAIGVNYNQVVKALRTRFSERKALSLLYKLEKATMQLVDINSRIVALSEEFRVNIELFRPTSPFPIHSRQKHLFQFIEIRRLLVADTHIAKGS